jgi:hypothetical protein
LSLQDGNDKAVPKLTTDVIGLKFIERFVEHGQERWLLSDIVQLVRTM